MFYDNEDSNIQSNLLIRHKFTGRLMATVCFSQFVLDEKT